MDKIGADFYRSVEMVGSRLGAKALVLQLPIGAENDFEGVVDLVEMKALRWDGSIGASAVISEIPSDLKEKAEEYRENSLKWLWKLMSLLWRLIWKVLCQPTSNLFLLFVREL